jgi:molecular chaperone GrpE
MRKGRKSSQAGHHPVEDGEGRGAAAWETEPGPGDPEGDGSGAPDSDRPATGTETLALREQLQEQQRAATEAQDRYIRTLADFDNYRKRQNSALEDARRYANESLIADLLPIVDNFDRALEAEGSQENASPILEGVRLIQRQLYDTLRKAGLEPIPAVGEPFDPTVHEAIMQVPPAPGQPPHQVVEELRKGYRLNGRVLRASLVKVTSG